MCNVWLTTTQVAHILGLDPRTLRKYETPDGKWCQVLGLRFRVYRYGTGPYAQRRYNQSEIMRLQESLSGNHNRRIGPS